MDDYTNYEVMQYIEEEDVKFIRLAFCDIYGTQKNVSIMPSELPRAFEYGIGFDASAIMGFGGEVHSDLFLHPDPCTITVLPWRPEHGKVVRMFCSVTYPDGTPFENDSRMILKNAIDAATKKGLTFAFGAEMEFYLFNLDENGRPTKNPYDEAGYMDIAPDDRGENIRREICLTLEQMGIRPESSHHEEGPGQNEIDFRYADPLKAADDAVTFNWVVKTVAGRNGLCADFSPKPLINCPGNGLHINLSVKDKAQRDLMPCMIAGIMDKIREISIFLNRTDASYDRLGNNKAPYYISWSKENRWQLIRVPAAVGEYRRVELRSADPLANPYIAFALLIYAVMEGIEAQPELPPAADVNLSTVDPALLSEYKILPRTRSEAARIAMNSTFVKAHLSESLINDYCMI